jgi:membrane protease YdiL (CAAX protease family)
MAANVSVRDRCALLVALVLPTVITLIYFVWLVKAAAFVYGPLKLLQFSFPLLWVFLLRRSQPAWRTTASTVQTALSVAGGIAFGLLVLGGGLTIYAWWLVPKGFFTPVLPAIHSKVADLGVTSPTLFIAVSIFYSLIHSLLEEYYWRWFVFREARAQLPLAPAIALSSFGFMAHHVLVLAAYFGWGSPYTYLLSLAVALGGAVWAWLYERYGTLLGPWISHAIIDAMIFIVGYDLVFHH